MITKKKKRKLNAIAVEPPISMNLENSIWSSDVPVSYSIKICFVLVAFAIIADVVSTYALFRDFPDRSLRGEQNKIIVEYYQRFGLPGVLAGFVRFWSSWLAIGIFGGFLMYASLIRFLNIKSIEKVMLSLAYGLLFAVSMNFGAGLSNTYLYLIYFFGGG